MSTTTIEWTDRVWNPTRGCTLITPGCANCYAKTFADRFVGVKGNPYELGFTPRTVPEKLAEPFTWTAPAKVFVNSMSDLFHKDFPDDYVEQVARVMAGTPWHTYQVLTKRHERLRDLLSGTFRAFAELPNVWWGVSVENKRHGLPRVEALRETPARVRFLSVEPLLEDLGEFDLSGIHWVICGGESGRKPRPIAADWVRSLRDQCAANGVPFFFKQWGGRNKKKSGRTLDGRTHDDMPAVSTVPIPSRAELKALAARMFPGTKTNMTPLPTTDDLGANGAPAADEG
jgi:protein gp37